MKKTYYSITPAYDSEDIDTPEKLWKWFYECAPSPARMPEFLEKSEAMWEERDVVKFIAECVQYFVKYS